MDLGRFRNGVGLFGVLAGFLGVFVPEVRRSMFSRGTIGAVRSEKDGSSGKS